MNLVRFHKPNYSVNRVLVDELFDNFFKNDYHENHVSRCSSPATNIFESENDFRIEMLLPGLNREDVQMVYQNNLLTIKVEKEHNENDEQSYKYAHREFGSFNFEKQYKLPKSVDTEKINAKFENGILLVTLPKKEEALEKAPVEIKVS